MADWEIRPENRIREFIDHGPKFMSHLAQDANKVEAVPTASGWAYPDANFIMVALCACVLAFMMVITVFIYHREKIRRIVTGENRRVGSVYYVRPGISAFQPTEI